MIEKSSNINSKRNNTKTSKEKLNNSNNNSFSISSFKTSMNFNSSINNIQDNTKIILRIKPKTEEEYLDNNKIFEIKDNSLIEFIGSKNNSKIFKFDYIFSEDSQQKEIFEVCAKDICDSLFEGYNGTIFAYGQIGSGKTYTMLGPNYTQSFLCNSNFILSQGGNTNNYLSYLKKKEEEGKGLVPRAIEYLLDKKEELVGFNNTNTNIELYCSFYEIFNDQIYDLFNNISWINNNSLNTKEKQKEGVLKDNLEKIKLNDKKEIFNLIKLGYLNLQSFSYIMNTQSKSHSIFSISICKTKLENDNIIKSTTILNLVDLASSDKQTSNENTGDQIKDAGKINKSFLGLGNVIQNFGENFIPIRDTKLTFLLKESLVVHPKTCFIATISSLKKNLQDTLFTLNFAQNIKKIKNNKIFSKKNKIEEENNKIITKEEFEKEKDIYNNSKNEVIKLVNLLEKIEDISPDIYKFKEKFKQNSLIRKYLNDEYEESYKKLLDKEKEIEIIKKENEIYENKINNLSIELIIKKQAYNNLVKKQADSEKEFKEIKQKFDKVYETWDSKVKKLSEKDNILKEQNAQHEKIIIGKKEIIDKNRNIIASKENQINNLKEKINELENNIINKNSMNKELEKEINELKEEIKVIDANYNKSEKELIDINNKLLDKNNKLNNVDNILIDTQKRYNNKLLNNKGDINKLNSIISQSTSNEAESKNRIFAIKNKIIEYDLYLEILKKTKDYLNNSLTELENRNKKYREELDEKINSYNNLIEINRDLKNKVDLLNKKFEVIGGNKKNTKESGTKSKIVKLNEENNELSKEVSNLNNILGNLYVNNNNIFQYHHNLDQKISEYKKIFNLSQKELIPLIEKNGLRKSISLIENINKIKNLKENQKLNLFTINLENAICLLKEKEELIKNMKIYNKNIRLKTINSVRENNVKTTEINLLKETDHNRNSFNL